jgi:hypothetical protein
MNELKIEILTKAANKYVELLNKIGASNNHSQAEEMVTLCIKECKKIRNGQLLFARRDCFANQLNSAKEWLGHWSIDVQEILIAADKHSAIIRYHLDTVKEGALAVIAILHFDSENMICEINEVHNRLEK